MQKQKPVSAQILSHRPHELIDAETFRKAPDTILDWNEVKMLGLKTGRCTPLSVRQVKGLPGKYQGTNLEVRDKLASTSGQCDHFDEH